MPATPHLPAHESNQVPETLKGVAVDIIRLAGQDAMTDEGMANRWPAHLEPAPLAAAEAAPCVEVLPRALDRSQERAFQCLPANTQPAAGGRANPAKRAAGTLHQETRPPFEGTVLFQERSDFRTGHGCWWDCVPRFFQGAVSSRKSRCFNKGAGDVHLLLVLGLACGGW